MREWLTVDEYVACRQERGEAISVENVRWWLHRKRSGDTRYDDLIARKEGTKYRGVWLISRDALDFEPPAVGRPAQKGKEGKQ